MFSKAYEVARKFTLPIIVSSRTIDGAVNCSWGAYVIVNDEGWFVTVAHIWEKWIQFQQEKKDVDEYKQKVAEIQRNNKLSPANKKSYIRKLKKNPAWITDCSVYFGVDGVYSTDVTIYGHFDIAIGKLEPFKPTNIEEYPVFKNPDQIKHGTSLCKLGYPLNQLNPTFDPATASFQINEGFPMPFFPLEGIFTRNIIGEKAPDGKTDIKFIETSSPGLPGQSGGPIFDKEGVVWAIQSKNVSHQIFSNTVKKNGKNVVENQYLNVGIGVHPEVIATVLSEHGIKFNMSD